MSKNIKQDAYELAALFSDRAQQLRAAIRTFDKREDIQAVINGCLSSLKAKIKHYENLSA